MQGSLFPVEIESIRPAPFKSADLKWLAIGLDQMQYAAKRLSDHPLLPATEWLCHHLAAASQIATPGLAVLQFKDGETAFGSRWEGGLEDAGAMSDNDLLGLFLSARRTSAILALDRFVCNPDRHLENFLYRQMPDGQMLALAFDYSRAAGIVRPPFGRHEFPQADCATVQQARWLKATGRFNRTEALAATDAANNITSLQLRSILEAMPPEWLTAEQVAALLRWWQSSARTKRAELTRQWIRSA